MDMLNSLLRCIPCAPAPRKRLVNLADNFSIEKSHGYASLSEKEPSIQPLTTKSSDRQTPDDAASHILTALLSATKPGPTLDASIRSIIHTHRPATASWSTWYASLAKAVFHRIEALLREGGSQHGEAMAHACQKASDAVDTTEGFAQKHPLWTTAVVAIVAFGILVLLAPYLLEALGFAEAGPVEGSFAAAWQARYLGAVPKGSLFGYFQRLGIVWKKVVVVQ